MINLQPVSRKDAPELIAGNIASRDHHHPWMRNFTDQVGFEEWFCNLQSSASLALIAREPESSSIIGVFTFSQIFMKAFRSAYLGYYSMVELAGRGLMTEALKQTVAYGFEEIGLHRIEANIQLDNQRSIALVQRAGFHKEGFSPRYLFINGDWRDHERWAIISN